MRIHLALTFTLLAWACAAVAKAQTPKSHEIEFCQQYKAEAQRQRAKGNRWEYTTAKRLFMSCLNTAHNKHWDKGIKKDMGDYMTQHELNDADNIPKELKGNRY